MRKIWALVSSFILICLFENCEIQSDEIRNNSIQIKYVGSANGDTLIILNDSVYIQKRIMKRYGKEFVVSDTNRYINESDGPYFFDYKCPFPNRNDCFNGGISSEPFYYTSKGISHDWIWSYIEIR